MWKDFFYFSKVQRVGIITLLTLIVLFVLANVLLPYFVRDKAEQPEYLTQEANVFRMHMLAVDSLKKAEFEKRYDEDKYFTRYDRNKYTNDSEYSLFVFDPNSADSSTFIRLGLKSYVASNILKFRKKGGVFKTSESFSKVYGLSDSKFKELESYIRIANESEPLAKMVKPASDAGKVKVDNIIVELNQADTTELMKVSGIGRGYAKGIVRFRQLTGGFVAIDQLKEIYGMTESNFQKIASHCTTNINLVRKINVNTASIDRLKAHPYLSFYQAKALYELRRRKVKLKNIDELKSLPEFTQESIHKIEPYLSFD